MTRGYWNQPELTAEKFVNNPFRQESIVYKTGDRVKWNSNSELIFLGRFDHQVKIRGYRIELGEIETALEKQDGVTGAIVLAHKDKLVAFVTVTSSSSLLLVGDKAEEKEEENISADTDEATIKAALVEQTILPEYMMPWRVVCMEKFPLTHNNKVNRSELPLPDIMTSRCHEYVPPQTAEESSICAVWESVLGVDNVGLTDNFFELGGHSLLAMELARQMSCQLSTLMANPTISELLKHADIDRMNGKAMIKRINQIEDTDSMTHAEARIVFLQLCEPRSST